MSLEDVINPSAEYLKRKAIVMVFVGSDTPFADDIRREELFPTWVEQYPHTMWEGDTFHIIPIRDIPDAQAYINDLNEKYDVGLTLDF